MINETLIIQRGFIIFCIVIFIWKMFQPKMILGFIGDWLERKYPLWLRYPICECTCCMSFWYGSAVFWLIWGGGLLSWVLTISVAAGLSTIFGKIK